jgi:hypothetical protein
MRRGLLLLVLLLRLTAALVVLVAAVAVTGPIGGIPVAKVERWHRAGNVRFSDKVGRSL